MKVYHEVLPDTLGKVMYRIREAYRRYAPSDISFVINPKEADLQVLDSIGTGSIPFIQNKNYILLQHCYITSEQSTKDFWLPYWNKAKVVVSFMDLPALSGTTEFPFLRLPIGVEPSVFYPINYGKTYQVMSTGYVAWSECIEEALQAVKNIHGKMVHVGGNIFPNEPSCKHYEKITDDQMRLLYNQSKYTIGMRKTEGFEAPLIEGTLCGSRGITLDYPFYRYWFGDIMEYVQDGDFNFVKNQLIDLFSKPYRPVTQEEMNLVKEKFSWEKVVNTFWNKVKETL